MEKEAMGGHVNIMVPLEDLSSDLPNGGVVLGHDKEEEISTLHEEIFALRSRQRHLNRRRREALDKLIDLKGSIRVFCRVRPSISTSNIKIKSPVTVEQENIVVRAAGIKKDFSVDRVFDQESTQGSFSIRSCLTTFSPRIYPFQVYRCVTSQPDLVDDADDVFHDVKPILRSALDGHNVCILAFGQTGTGKTYTMEGTSDNLGVVPRAIQELFSHAARDTSSTYSFSISMLEVYMGSLRDLLAPRQQPLFRSTEGNTTCNLSILATTSGSVQVEGLTDVAVPDLKKANQWYCRGRRSRSTSWTNVNNVSSRSHCLTRITIRRCGGVSEQVSKLWLVDLGGSERLLKTGASGLTMDEGKAINLSLSALGDVIAALRRKRSHVPYRNSKLTQILSDSLGDGSKVVMVVHISPSRDDVGETICSLGFAKRAMLIESSRELSEDLKMLKRKRLAELDKEMRDAEQELGALNEQIRSAETSAEERKKLSPSVACQALGDEKGSPRSILVAADSPRATERAKSRMVHHGSVPHFMSATVCSRQRHGAAAHSVGKPRLTKSVNAHSSKPSGSQSFSHSASKARSSAAFSSGEPRLKHLSVKSDQINVSSNSIDSTAASAPRPRPRESFVSGPAQLRAPLHQHRRRMSCLT